LNDVADPVNRDVDFPAGSGEMATLIRAFDWSRTPAGPIGQWPRALKSIVAAMVESPTAMVLLWGVDGVMIYNDAYSRFAGGRHPEQLGMKVVSEGWPEVAEFNANVLRVGLAGGTLSYKDQELTLYRNGQAEQVWMDLDYSPVRDEVGRPGGVIAIVLETTARHQAISALRASEQRYRTLFESMGESFCVIEAVDLPGTDRLDFRYVAVNPAFSTTVGVGDVVGKTISELFPEEPQAWYDIYQKVVETGEPIRFERGLLVQGVVLELYAFRIEDGTGRRVGVIFSNVTARKLAEDARNRSEARLRELNADLEREVAERSQARSRAWRLSPDLMGALNAEGYLESSNPAWQVTLGWSEDEIRETTIFELLHPDDVERSRADFELCLSGQAMLRYSNRYRSKGGDYRWISWFAIPEDRLLYCVGRDITDERAAAADLVQAQDELRQAQKMEAVGQLTGGIAHDFNNLLAGLSGSLEILQKRISESRFDGAERYIDMAQASAQRAAALTQRLLSFSRRQTLDPKPTDIDRLVVGMTDLIRGTMGPSVQVEIIGAEEPWLTCIDPSQLENTLLNLAINGRDAMPDGGRLTIETANKWLDAPTASERGLPQGSYVILSVTDTGTGMTPEVIERAFDPFYTTKPTGQGTGLGLSMIHGFVRQSGGQIRIHSDVGVGTTMNLYLPRFLGELDAPTPANDEVRPEHAHGETVLVIDDEEFIRVLIREVLEDAGYKVLDAADGADGLKILRSNVHIDLLLTDVGLPGGLNGRQVADAARATRTGLKVLFATGYAENALAGSGKLSAGMQVITKPFSMPVLTKRVRDILSS
jgi:PAS domain S-box-containing protein